MRARALLAAIAAAAASIALPAPASADPRGRAGADPINLRIDGERSSTDIAIIASLGGGAVLAGGIGLLFTLDSRRKSDRISTSHRPTGRTYTREVDSIRRSALRSRKAAIVSFSVAAALLAGTAIAYVVTDPGTEVVDLEEYERRLGAAGSGAPSPTVEPQPGGAILGVTWGF